MQAKNDFISPTLQKSHFRPLPRYVLVDLWIVVRILVRTNHKNSADSCLIIEFKHPTFQCVLRAILPEVKSDHGPHLVARLRVSLTILPPRTCLYGLHRDTCDVKTFIAMCNNTLILWNKVHVLSVGHSHSRCYSPKEVFQYVKQ
jgi:hypothetical protein